MPLEKEPREALQAVLTLNHDEKTPTDDEVIGDAAPHIAGDSWLIHADVMERSFRDEGDEVRVSGRATLLHTAVVKGTPCLEVEAQIKMISGDEPAALVETGERPAHQEMQITARSILPLDTSRQELSWTDSVTVQTTFRVAVFCSPCLRSAQPVMKHVQALASFRQRMSSQAKAAKRVTLRIGDTLFADKGRVLHGHDAIARQLADTSSCLDAREHSKSL